MNEKRSSNTLPTEDRLIGLPMLDREVKLWEKYVAGRSGRPDTRFEIYGYPMRIGKFAFTFQSLEGKRQISYLAIYLDCCEAIRLMRMLATGEVPQQLIAGRYYWVSDRMGSLTKAGPEFRSLKVSKSTAHPGDFYLTADRCQGVESERGLWNPTKEKGTDGKPLGYRAYGVPISPREAYAAYKKMDAALYGMAAAQYCFAMLQDTDVKASLGLASRPVATTVNPETGEVVEHDPAGHTPAKTAPAAPAQTPDKMSVPSSSPEENDDMDFVDEDELPF